MAYFGITGIFGNFCTVREEFLSFRSGILAGLAPNITVFYFIIFFQNVTSLLVAIP